MKKRGELSNSIHRVLLMTFLQGEGYKFIYFKNNCNYFFL